MKTLRLLFIITFTVSIVSLSAQDNTTETEIDASKPTNFYSMLDNTLEYSSQSNQNVYGYRGKLMIAPSEAHLVLAEVPMLYNDRTKKFGVGDLRARYFYLPYKNYDNFLGAFGPSIDIFVPTGSFENGLGSGRLVVSPGVTVGLMASETIQFFPILSYQYSSKPIYDNPTPETNKATNGLSFQVITPIVFSDKFFMQVTPILKMNDLGNARQDRFIQEVFASYAIHEKMQLTGFYSGNFQDKIHTASIGLTIFL